jgi:putative ubiquitin-RnfH superfamily antitoxin RatB of RatAB toxin-antitoxin module
MGRLRVEVVYATPAMQDIVAVEIEEGSGAYAAFRASGLADRHPGIAGTEIRLGIFGKSVAHDTKLRDGDRVEVYRLLQVNPKEARRARASRKPPKAR